MKHKPFLFTFFNSLSLIRKQQAQIDNLVYSLVMNFVIGFFIQEICSLSCALASLATSTENNNIIETQRVTKNNRHFLYECLWLCVCVRMCVHLCFVLCTVSPFGYFYVFSRIFIPRTFASIVSCIAANCIALYLMCFFVFCARTIEK